jgi:hypothetical protein
MLVVTETVTVTGFENKIRNDKQGKGKFIPVTGHGGP